MIWRDAHSVACASVIGEDLSTAASTASPSALIRSIALFDFSSLKATSSVVILAFSRLNSAS
ncbi:hypothetical protein D3C73_1559370 [compost metagenome]